MLYTISYLIKVPFVCSGSSIMVKFLLLLLNTKEITVSMRNLEIQIRDLLLFAFCLHKLIHCLHRVLQKFIYFLRLLVKVLSKLNVLYIILKDAFIVEVFHIVVMELVLLVLLMVNLILINMVDI